ncbi:MAG: winged helix-turn-helix domain-containing protein [Candidatus Eremiobacteraeota bacterium]|nr:winged helix-turn-helix domain-containing protein [Candidatus Eremiobacteraeota bacterium]
MISRFGAFELDTASMTLRAAGRPVSLPKKAVELLAALAGRRGEVVTKSELMEMLWPEGFVEEANLSQYVYLLRQAFERYDVRDVIETYPRRGYCFTPPAPLPERAGFQRAALTLAMLLVLLFVGGSARSVTPQFLPSAEARQAYSLGRYFWNLRSVDGMQRSVRYFRRVITLAPRSALGYAALANAYTELADLEGPCHQWGRWKSLATVLASRALAVDATSAEAHVAYAMATRVFENDNGTADRELRTALRLDPNNALANEWYGNYLIAQGKTADGVTRLQFAASKEPISTATYAWLARGYYYERRYDDARRYALAALALQPTRLETTVLAGLIEEARRNYPQALHYFEDASRLGLSSADTEALVDGIYAATGRRMRALLSLQRIAGRPLDCYESRDVAIGFLLADDAPAARAVLSRIRYATPLDRDLTVQDPHIRSLITT